jgi:1-deoxy-D-xylulose-5-phosphate reductoisomerase
MAKIRRICLLGASGSIGRQTIDVVKQYPDRFSVTCLSVGNNLTFLEQDIIDLKPARVCLMHDDQIDYWRLKYPKISFVSGDRGLIQLAIAEYDILVNALVGFVGLVPTIEAIKVGKDIALANKETLVVAGNMIIDLVKKHRVNLIPVDSEHSAIFQCMQGSNWQDVAKIIITASGGSFRQLSHQELKYVTKAQALNHPNWSMGAKITIDSATMMNKVFEIIEAFYLFNLKPSQIETVLHPQSIVHSLVQFNDNSLLAQLSVPDMRQPIQYALAYPDKLPLKDSKNLNLTELTFKAMDFDRYPFINLAYEVMSLQGNAGCIINAANEECVKAFLEEKIDFLAIEEIVFDVFNEVDKISNCSLDDLINTDIKVRALVKERLKGVVCQ